MACTSIFVKNHNMTTDVEDKILTQANNFNIHQHQQKGSSTPGSTPIRMESVASRY